MVYSSTGGGSPEVLTPGLGIQAPLVPFPPPLEGLRLKHGINHFALSAKLYLKAIRHAFDELQLLKAA